MKLVHFTLADQFHFGMITDANEFIDLDTACRDYFGVNPVKGADPSRFRDMQTFFQGGGGFRPAHQEDHSSTSTGGARWAGLPGPRPGPASCSRRRRG